MYTTRYDLLNPAGERTPQRRSHGPSTLAGTMVGGYAQMELVVAYMTTVRGGPWECLLLWALLVAV